MFQPLHISVQFLADLAYIKQLNKFKLPCYLITLYSTATNTRCASAPNNNFACLHLGIATLSINRSVFTRYISQNNFTSLSTKCRLRTTYVTNNNDESCPREVLNCH